MTSQPTPQEPDLDQVDRAWVRLVWKLATGLSIAAVIIGALLLALVGEVTANHAKDRAAASQAAALRASAEAQAQCQLDKTVADAALPAQTTEFGLKISAAARVAYIDAGCHLGPLSKPNPRLLPLLAPRYR